MKLIYIRPFGGFAPGDEVEVPDGAEYSGWYLAEPDHPEARRAVAGRNTAPAPAAEAAVVTAVKAAVTGKLTQTVKEGA